MNRRKSEAIKACAEEATRLILQLPKPPSRQEMFDIVFASMTVAVDLHIEEVCWLRRRWLEPCGDYRMREPGS